MKTDQVITRDYAAWMDNLRAAGVEVLESYRDLSEFSLRACHSNAVAAHAWTTACLETGHIGPLHYEEAQELLQDCLSVMDGHLHALEELAESQFKLSQRSFHSAIDGIAEESRQTLSRPAVRHS
jgi:hypothetical protein